MCVSALAQHTYFVCISDMRVNRVTHIFESNILHAIRTKTSFFFDEHGIILMMIIFSCLGLKCLGGVTAEIVKTF